MMNFLRRAILAVAAIFVFVCVVAGQTYVRPGFEGAEYRELLRIGHAQSYPKPDAAASRGSAEAGAWSDSAAAWARPVIGAPEQYVFSYRSAEVGMRNRWELWVRKDRRVAVIAVRGTIGDPVSWLENFYAAQVPATGSLQLNDSNRFEYRLAADDKAMVHVGWLVGLGYLAPSIVQQIRKAYDQGIHEFILFGHSQGGGLAFLIRSYLYYLQQKGTLPADLYIKTYCSAAPKPGNTYYAYDFDFITRGGWGLTVVNAADWVPETPFSLQRLEDMNRINPFVHIDKALKGQSLIKRWFIKGKYNKLRRRSRKAAKAFRQVLGDLVYKQVRRALPSLQPPGYADGMNYQRAGTPVVLEPDSVYHRLFPDDPGQVFQHHALEAYDWLTTRFY
jgi:Lipase (class 3)